MHDFEQFMAAVYATVDAMRDGHIHEAEVESEFVDDETDKRVSLTVRVSSEVRHYAPMIVREDGPEPE